MEKVLTHPAPHQGPRGGHGGIDCTLISQSPYTTYAQHQVIPRML